MRQPLSPIALASVLATALVPASAKDSQEASPDTALRIVLDTQRDKLRAIDSPDSWWHDTRERSWLVKRPVEPGVLDTTHTFTVTYSIDGVAVASWWVDANMGTAVVV